MGRKRKDYSEKMQPVNISMPGWMADRLRKEPNYSELVRKLVKEYFLRKDLQGK